MTKSADITFTVDLEDPTERYAADGRYVVTTQRILDLCTEKHVRATFFTIGKIASSAPALIREIASRGHEIAYHSHNHVSLTKEDPERFRRQSSEDKARLEQISGHAVTGFRAPRFSLTPKSVWAIDVLGDLGFRYSSSLMPTELSLFGFPNVPRATFSWPNGLIEFPLPVADLGKYKVPYLGGIYLYTMPFFLLKMFLTKTRPEETLWTYTHPYDFDSDEGFFKLPHTPFWISLVLWLARKNAAPKIRKLLDLGVSLPLGERAALLSQTPNMKLAVPVDSRGAHADGTD